MGPGHRRRRQRRQRAHRLRWPNETFYDTQPGIYLTTRAAHYALVASNDAEHRQRLADGVDIDGRTKVSLDVPPRSESYPSWSQRVAAIDGEALTAHASETVMRWVHAHAVEGIDSPWIEMSKVYSHAKFKEWVRKNIVDAPSDRLLTLVSDVFPLPHDVPQAPAIVGAWLQRFAAVFLEADSYNAAKHGLAVRGRSMGWTIEITDALVFEMAGNQVEFLRSEYVKDDGSRRYFMTEIVTDPAMVVPFVEVAVSLLEALIERGRECFLGERATPMQALPRYVEVLRLLGHVGGKPTIRSETEIVLDDLKPGTTQVNFSGLMPQPSH